MSEDCFLPNMDFVKEEEIIQTLREATFFSPPQLSMIPLSFSGGTWTRCWSDLPQNSFSRVA